MLSCQSRISSCRKVDAPAVVGARRDVDGELRLVTVRVGLPVLSGGTPVPGLARHRGVTRAPHFQVLDGDHGAVEELLLPLRRADADAVADGDLQRLRHPPVQVPAHLDHGALRLGRLVEHPLPHQPRQRPRLGARARQHHRRGVGLRTHMPFPVLDQLRERLLLVVAEMKPAAKAPRLDRLLRLPVPERLRHRHLPRRERRLAVHRLVVRENGVPLTRRREPGPEPRLLGRLPWTCVSTSSRSAFWRRMRSTRMLPATSRINLQPRPRLHRLLLAGVAREHHLGPWRSESWRM